MLDIWKQLDRFLELYQECVHARMWLLSSQRSVVSAVDHE